jgi:hypothetical protein
MDPGQIAGNRSIDAAIKRCFAYLSAQEVQAFTRKFREQLQDERQVMHTFRELLLGAYLGSRGLRICHEPNVRGRTPDWGILGSEGEVQGLVELVNFHAPAAMEQEIEERRRAGRIWVGRVPSHSQRLASTIEGKATTYRRLVEEEGFSYVVTVFGDFVAGDDLDDVRGCVADSGIGLFGMHPILSGVLYFEEAAGTYSFSFIANPHAARTVSIPNGQFA